jgi:hypothetical protein
MNSLILDPYLLESFTEAQAGKKRACGRGIFVIMQFQGLLAAATAVAVLLNGALALAASGNNARADPVALSLNDGAPAGQQTNFLAGATFDAGTNLDLAARLDPSGSLSPETGLLFALLTPSTSETALLGQGEFEGATVPLATNLNLQFGVAVASDYSPQFSLPILSSLAQMEAERASNWGEMQSALVGADWDFASGMGLGVFAAHGNQQSGILSGPLSMANRSSTTAMGVSAHVNFGSGWVTSFAYNEGVTQLDLRPNSLVSADPAHRSADYGLAIAKHGLFGDDSLGLTVTRPVRSEAINLQLVPFGESSGDALENRVSLLGPTPETDLELGYVTTFLDGALALQANAGYQMNLAGQSGTNGVSVLSRAKINF